jgi:hypothetical protein
LRVHHGVLLFIGGTLNLRTLNPFSKKLNQFYRKEFTLSEDHEGPTAYVERINEPNLDFESVVEELQASGKI